MDFVERAKQAQSHSDMLRNVSESSLRRIVLDARAKGRCLVFSRDGKVVHVPASEVVLPGEEGYVAHVETQGNLTILDEMSDS